MTPDPIPRMRLRFAPSPTGQLHVGNARTALFNWLLAHGQGGIFVLRIEDTDFERSTHESERSMVEDLRWMGLTWDEGLEAGGDHGPYRQSERLHIYRAHAVELMAAGHAYHCFCSAQQLEDDRAAALAAGLPPKYAGRCRQVSRDDARRRIEHGESAVVRFRVPEGREVSFTDLVRGVVTFHTDVIGDPVLMRSDGVPAYNYAVVIDDALMEITHVIRGEDHISNTPRQLLLYEAFGWTPPAFAHVSLVMGPDHSPLSKRHGATSVAEFRARGFLPEALTNYLALLGWSPGEGQELMRIDDLATRFRLEDVGHSAGVFDIEKLSWVNRHYLKAASPDRLAALAVPYLQQRSWVSTPSSEDLEYLARIVPIAAASLDRLEQVSARLAFLFDYSASRTLESPDIRAEAERSRPVIASLAEELKQSGPLLDRETFRAAAGRIRERTGQKGKALFHPIRLVLTGEAEGLELDVAVPAIEQGAMLRPPDRAPIGDVVVTGVHSGIRPILSARERAAAFADALERALGTERREPKA